MSQPLIVVGIDPGTITMGYGVVERRPSRVIHIDNGLIKAKPRAPLHERLQIIYEQLTTVLGRFKPDVVAVESVFVMKNPKAALHLGHGRGVALLAAAQCGADIVSYEPTVIKKTVAGRGRADKYQMQMMVRTLLGLLEAPAEDAADALAAGICHCYHETENSIRDRLSARARL